MERGQLEHKINIPRNLEGEPQTEALHAIETLSAELELENPTIVGVAPYGSVIRGTGIEGSDVDIVLLVDDENFSHDSDERLCERAQQVWQRISQEQQAPSNLAVHIRNINIKQLESGFSNPALASVFLTVTGDKVSAYRTELARYIKTLPDNQQTQLKARIVDELQHNYDLNSSKTPNRLGLSPAQYGELNDARRTLWEKRVESILSI